jgi:gamma-glutamylcyclotransferase (GGCT)/AIG2-like uncharacterized protein YtfP
VSARRRTTRIFVYGSLLSGQPNHRVLARAALVVEAVTEPRFALHDLGAFPGMVAGGEHAIAGEVYAVDADTLAAVLPTRADPPRRRDHRRDLPPDARAGRRSPGHRERVLACAPEGDEQMKIVMRDGRVFQGIALQIVKAMQDIAFGVEQMTLDQYIDWVVQNAQRFEEVELKVAGETTEERAKALVDEMLAKGLAAR